MPDKLSRFDQMTPVERVGAIYKAWEKHDFDAMAAFVDENFRLHIHMSPTSVPYAGESIGRAAYRAALTSIVEIFEVILTRPTKIMVLEDGSVNVKVEFVLRHLPSSATYYGSCRDHWQVANGSIVALDSYHDAAKFEAFVRLASDTDSAPT